MLTLRRKTVIGFAILIIIAFLVVGCGQSNPATDNDGAVQPSEKFVWELATSWPQGSMMHAQAEDFAKRVNEAAAGQLTIHVHPAGAVVDGTAVLDAANDGTIDAYHSFTGYWIGKMPAAPFFGSVPMTSEPFLFASWIYEGGGQELWQRMYDESGQNEVVMPLGILSPENLAWSNKPIKSLEDWKGLKYRTSGWWAEILRDQGAAVAVMAAGELYPSLERGVLDALEFTTPYGDKTLGFYEVADYIATPGIHQPGSVYYLGINKDKWNALPSNLKSLVETSARAASLWTWTWDFNNSLNAMDEYKKMGIEVSYLDRDAQLKIQKATWDMLDKRAIEEGGIFAEIWDSLKTYRERVIDYEKFMVPVRE